MVGLDLLFPVPHILMCVVHPIDSMVGRPGFILCCLQWLFVVFYRVLPYSLMLDGKPAVVVGVVVLVY